MPEGDTAATIASSVYAGLRADILRAELPPAAKLRIEFICERYQAGASPVREALSRLSSEGLVERRDQRGFYVAGISADELRELAMARCWVEGHALKESIRRRTQEWEETLVLAFHRLSRTPRSIGNAEFHANAVWENLHKAFHAALIGNCGSRFIVRHCADLRDLSDRYRAIAAARSFGVRNERDEHAEVMEAALAGDGERAANLLELHYQRTADIVLETMSIAWQGAAS